MISEWARVKIYPNIAHMPMYIKANICLLIGHAQCNSCTHELGLRTLYGLKQAVKHEKLKDSPSNAFIYHSSIVLSHTV